MGEGAGKGATTGLSETFIKLLLLISKLDLLQRERERERELLLRQEKQTSLEGRQGYIHRIVQGII
jgi:hypothetical protein